MLRFLVLVLGLITGRFFWAWALLNEIVDTPSPPIPKGRPASLTPMGEKLCLWIFTEIEKHYELNLRGDRSASDRIRQAAADVQEKFAQGLDVSIELPFIAMAGGRPVHFIGKTSLRVIKTRGQ